MRYVQVMGDCSTNPNPSYYLILYVGGVIRTLLHIFDANEHEKNKSPVSLMLLTTYSMHIMALEILGIIFYVSSPLLGVLLDSMLSSLTHSDF